MAAARLAASLLLLAAQVACEFGVLRVVPQSGGTRGRDYCILYNPQWAHLPHDLNKVSLLKLRDLSTTQLCSHLDVPVEDFTNQIALVARGNCTFYEKVRLAQGSGAHGLLIVSKERLVPPRGNKTQYEEISIPVALLSHRDLQDIFRRFGHEVMVALYAPSEPVMDYNMVIIFIMAVGTVALGGYWAGSHDVKKYMKHKRDDVPEKQEDEAVDVTPVMICVFVVMCCFMLVLLYYFYDRLVYVIIGIFCLASSTGLYSCLAPCVRKLPFCTCRVPDNNLPYFHKRPQARMLLLALFCVTVSVVWGVFRNEDQWAWVLQDTLGIAFCLYMLRTIRLPTFKVRAAMAGQVNSWWGAEGLGAQVSRAVLAPTGLHTAAAGALRLRHLLRLHHPLPDQGRSPLPSQLPAPPLPWLTTCLVQSGNSIMVEVATGPSNSSTHEKLPMVLKVPRLNTSPLSLCDRPFSLLGFGDILVPGLLVAYCHRFDIQVQSSRIYFVACTIAYGLGLLVTFVALVLMRHGQPALLYLVPCTLLTSCTVALWRREMGAFWTGSGFAKDAPQTPWAAPQGPVPPKDVDASLSEQPRGEELAQSPLATEEAGATDPAKDPDSPVAGPLSPSNGDQVQPIPVVTPGTSA
ncbi:signal peptide peptidase-like 2B isoform X8 [Rattus norvegicus]|uniref:signal peptide peptidase-like 2B isoform X8 n=1 Tax=Rattus norvegicus TaxID=10116 RepID=UPI0004E48278|nr:signal peptide peptidase-like 2B isoform X2 [Rattus norvegicus]|eukprot:XP_008763334.1 PREDICTED: signal peptide peptidase-like 2B isoform X2 [Rattus norvegicus]